MHSAHKLSNKPTQDSKKESGAQILAGLHIEFEELLCPE